MFTDGVQGQPLKVGAEGANTCESRSSICQQDWQGLSRANDEQIKLRVKSCVLESRILQRHVRAAYAQFTEAVGRGQLHFASEQSR